METQPIELKPNHYYFGREVNLSRNNNPLHHIKISSVNEKRVTYYDLFQGGKWLDVRPSFFKDSLFGKMGIMLITDLGEDKPEVVAMPPELPPIPNKHTFGDFTMEFLSMIKPEHLGKNEVYSGLDDDTICKNIALLCCKYAKIDIDDPMLYTTRKYTNGKPYMTTRKVMQYLMKIHTRFSLSQVGKITGGKDHSTVVKAIQSTKDAISTKDDFVIGMIGFVKKRITAYQ